MTTRLVSAAVAFTLSLAVGTARTQTLKKLAMYQGEDRQQLLMEGAGKEGALLFYTTFPTEYAEQLIEPFKNKYGIKVDVWRARSISMPRPCSTGRKNRPACSSRSFSKALPAKAG